MRHARCGLLDASFKSTDDECTGSAAEIAVHSGLGAAGGMAAGPRHKILSARD